MTESRVLCDGFQMGRLFVPAFQLRAGNLVCLHVPPEYSEENKELLSILDGEQTVAAVQFLGSVARMQRPVPERRFLWRWENPRCVDWLTRSAGLTEEQSVSILHRLKLPLDVRIGSLAGDPKLLVGLEAVMTRGADIIVFDTTGASPHALEKAYATLQLRPNGPAFLQVFHGFEKWRVCSPAACCVPLIPRTASCNQIPTAEAASTP